MRKGMWKKGLTVAMAAAMLAGPVSVPAVFNNGVAVVKAGMKSIFDFFIMICKDLL